jgi:hypothetical protein
VGAVAPVRRQGERGALALAGQAAAALAHGRSCGERRRSLAHSQAARAIAANGSVRPCREILTPARCGSDLPPARSALSDGPAQVRFLFFFLFFFCYPYCFFFLFFFKSKQFSISTFYVFDFLKF